MRMRVELRSVFSLTGTLLRWLSLAFLLPLLVCLIYREPLQPFLFSMTISYGVGLGLEYLDRQPDIGVREAYLMVAFSWLAVAVVGALPYVLHGQGTLAHPLNALFESMSGFTTTGSTVMGDISLANGHGLMMWRQLTQWLGGMGIVVLAVAILPRLSVGGNQLMKQETPGPGMEKLTPRIVETARRLWLLYVALTAGQILVLYALHYAGDAPKMDLYNAVAHAFTTMPTGGFSPEARSIEAFSPVVQWSIIPFMVIAGTNFTLLWFFFSGRVKKLFNDGEWRFYMTVIGIFGGLAFILLGTKGSTVIEVEPTLRHALFQVVSMVTTTGYASFDFNLWSAQLQGLLLLAMFVGGCAGSTGGSVKTVRWWVVLKSIGRELFVSVHSAAVRPVRLGERVIDEKTIRGILVFIFMYFLLFVAGTGIVLIDAHANGASLSLLEATAGSASTLGNVGPAFEGAGPMNSYLAYPPVSRFMMVLLMWLGRLEVVTVLVLLTPSYWTT